MKDSLNIYDKNKFKIIFKMCLKALSSSHFKNSKKCQLCAVHYANYHKQTALEVMTLKLNGLQIFDAGIFPEIVIT
jgi:hypothetical protein